MKVFFVNFSPSWGGGEQWHLSNASALLRCGYETGMITRTGSILGARAKQAGLTVHEFHINRRFSNVDPFKHYKVYRFLQHENPDAIIANGPNELKIAGFMGHFTGVKKIIYRRGNYSRIKPYYINRMLFGKTTHLIVTAQSILDQLNKDFGSLLPCRQFILPNGIQINPGPFFNDFTSGRIAVVARLSQEKGVDLAIRAFAKVAVKCPDARLSIMGEGRERDHLIKLAGELGILEKTDFMGQVEHPMEVLKNCSVFLLPSRWEGFSTALIESMNMQLPAVAFEIDAACTKIRDGETGYLVPCFDVVKMAEKLVHLLKNPDLCRSMGMAAYQVLCDHFDENKTILMLESILKD